MSILTVTVCEECGKQSTTCDGWLVIESLDIRAAKAGPLFLSEHGIDLCSQGCALRYVSRSLERAVSAHETADRRANGHHIAPAA